MASVRQPVDFISGILVILLNEVHNFNEYLINLTTLSHKMYDEIKNDGIYNKGIIDSYGVLDGNN